MIWILLALFCAMSCSRCRRRRRRRCSGFLGVYLMFAVIFGLAGHGLWVPIMACIAIGYFLRKIQEMYGEDCCPDISDEEMEQGLEEE